MSVVSGPSRTPTVSADGRVVVYAAAPPTEDGRTSTIWLLDRSKSTTTELTAAVDGLRPGNSVRPVVSADGCHVVVVTEIPYDLFRDDDTGARWDVYQLTLPACGGTAGDWELISSRPEDTFGSAAGDDADPDESPVVSGSGTIVAYTRDFSATTAAAGLRGIAVVDRSVPLGQQGRTRAVAGTPAQVPDTTFRYHGLHEPSISDDGRFLAFTSDATSAAAVPTWADGDVAGEYATSQVYVWDRSSPDPGSAVTVVSTPAGGVANGDAGHASVSHDGRYVAFQSTATNLVGGAVFPACTAPSVPAPSTTTPVTTAPLPATPPTTDTTVASSPNAPADDDDSAARSNQSTATPAVTGQPTASVDDVPAAAADAGPQRLLSLGAGPAAADQPTSSAADQPTSATVDALVVAADAGPERLLSPDAVPTAGDGAPAASPAVAGNTCPAQIYRVDRSDGSILLVSRQAGAPGATPVAADAGGTEPAITYDGSTVVFTTRSTNLFDQPAGTPVGPAAGEIVLATVATGTLTRASVLADGATPAPPAQWSPRPSADARVVVFETAAATAFDASAASPADPHAAIAALAPHVEMAPLDVGSAAVGVPSAPWYVGVHNFGPGPFVPASIASSNPDFAVVGGTCRLGVAIAAGETCEVYVVLTPRAGGPVQGVLTVSEGGFGATSASTSMAGFGGAGALAAPVAGHDFGATGVGSSTAATTMQIVNVGYEPVAMSGVDVVGPAAGDFEVKATTCQGTLAVRATCTVDLAFRPTLGGQRVATVRVKGDAGEYASMIVAGSGVYSAATLIGATDRVLAGTRLGVGGSGFPANATVTLSWADGFGGTYTVQAGKDGTFLASLQIAPSERPGHRTLIARTVKGPSAVGRHHRHPPGELVTSPRVPLLGARPRMSERSKRRTYAGVSTPRIVRPGWQVPVVAEPGWSQVTTKWSTWPDCSSSGNGWSIVGATTSSDHSRSGVSSTLNWALPRSSFGFWTMRLVIRRTEPSGTV
ncbi:MAG: choice-of-anchor D domain-containing protein [Ilumatobacteraceae bacterium]